MVALVWDIDRAGMATTGESKHVVILMDRSWEPALRPAVEMVHDILITIVRLQDQVGVATTGGEWLVDLGPKAGRQAHLIKKVAAASELSAGIALDHSILLCLEVLATAARSEEASQWLLVFSDGHGGDLDSAEATAGRESGHVQVDAPVQQRPPRHQPHRPGNLVNSPTSL